MSSVSIQSITTQIFGSENPTTHLFARNLNEMDVILEGTYRRRVVSNAPMFSNVAAPAARVGAFIVKASAATRVFLCVLPATGVPDAVIVGIPPGLEQNRAYYEKLHGADPTSDDLIKDSVALVTGDGRAGKAQPNYGTQVLTSKRPMALLFPVRALAAARPRYDSELGPFVHDATVIEDTIRGIAAATGGAFLPNQIEGFTHSSGIWAFNTFLRHVAGKFTVRNAFSFDPASHAAIDAPAGTTVLQYLSGHTGGVVNGRPTGNFEYMPFERWANDRARAGILRANSNSKYVYLHSFAFPRYLLRLSIWATLP